MGHAEYRTGTQEIAPYYIGIVLNPDGTFRPLPFRTKRIGIWYFDGQFYFMKNGIDRKQ